MTASSPLTLHQALDMLSGHPLPILAGGTDFYPMLQNAPPPPDVVDISQIAELKGIAKQGQAWRIGAATTWSELIATDLPPAFDALKIAGREVGSVQIQNRATIAGNLCNASPAADGVPPLLALDAGIELASASGIRVLPLEDFITGNRTTERRPDELVSAILVPDAAETAQSHFVKLGARRYLVISIAMIALVVRMDNANRIADIRIAVGACSAVARRLRDLENDLTGLDTTTADAAAIVSASHLSPLSPIDDLRANAAYRLSAVEETLRRMITEATRPRRAA
jgi:CO/xanthine dehydrogenase FAD-binding subunit